MEPVAGRRIARRRITRNGRSITILIPRPFVYALGLARSTDLVLELYAEHRGLTIVPFSRLTQADLDRWRIEGSVVAQRKLTKYGNGFSVAVPRAFLLALHVFTGDTVTLALDDASSVITVRPLRPRDVTPAPPTSLKGLMRTSE